MPIYEYVCTNCGERTEVIQRVGEKPVASCPHCGKRALKKAISAPAIQFKGSGWYVTDYARAKKEEGSSSKGEKAEKSSDGEKAGKAEKVESSDKADKPEKKKKDKKD
jgi:putative FmdB family regulatory protein